ncbi:MAG: hypothetical protein PWQ20_1273 [Thermotogaceae bacterium]|jgi:hypothetical protein|nr:hypothetical protein [Thermotogaceae bacterium]MDN5338203.1 hypothetical protein [Thermotogaceae bacterium]
MNLDFFNDFSDSYLKTNEGKGVFLAGVVLGMVAKGQVQKSGGKIEDSPLFKQLNFGKMSLKDLKRHLSRVPDLLKAYDINYSEFIKALLAQVGEYLFKSPSKELGVDGNFTFALAFLNCSDYFWGKIFPKREVEENVQQ